MRILCAAVLAFAASPAVAAPDAALMNKASSGYVYFHRSGVDMAAHDAAVEACIHETMRLKPVAPLLPSQANRDTTIGDVEVPANTFVIGVMRHDSLDARYFPEPGKFDPDRWLADTARAPNAKSTTRVSMPFGAGPRLCPGRYLAMLEMKMAMAMLLGSFRIEHVGTRDGKPARELFAFAMGPAGLRMKLARSS